MNTHPTAQTKKRASYTNTIGICRVCGAYCDYLPTHLRYAHHLELEEYTKRFCRGDDAEMQRWNPLASSTPVLKPRLGY